MQNLLHLSNIVLYFCVFSGDMLFLQELKECTGHVFVDSVPEFCLPEVSLFKAVLKNLPPFNHVEELAK